MMFGLEPGSDLLTKEVRDRRVTSNHGQPLPACNAPHLDLLPPARASRRCKSLKPVIASLRAQEVDRLLLVDSA